jgi:hypothetical protein
VGDEAMGATVKGKPGPDETCLGEFAQVGVGKAAMIVHTEIEFDLTGNRAGDFERTALAIYEVIDRLLAAVDRIDRAAPASA